LEFKEGHSFRISAWWSFHDTA